MIALLDRRGPRHRGRCSTAARLIARRAVVLATGGAAALWARTTNPPGAIGGGLLLAYDAGAELADLELMQFHPTAVVGAQRRRRLPGHRGGPRRGRARCSTPPASASSTSSPRATRSPARSSARWTPTGAASVGLDMRDVDPALFPNVVGALRRAGIDPERELVPVAPAAHYMMGGIATDLDGRATLARAVRGRRVLVHRAARRQPAGLQLAQRVLRVRRPGRARGARRAGAARAAAADARRPTGEPPPPPISPESRAALWRYAGLERNGDGLRALADDPHPLVRLIARSRAGPRGEPRRPPAHRLPRARSRRSTAAT